MAHSSITLVMIIALCSMISTSNGQLEAIQNAAGAIGSTAQCLQKLPQCNPNKPNDMDRQDNKRMYCCYSAAWVRCLQGIIESTCPGTPLTQLVSAVETGAPGSLCEGYTFWTPECLYTSYMIAVIGSAAGLAVLLLIIIIVICCCCCRSKK